MGITIAFEILALFAGSIFALLAFSFASRAISGGFIPALAVVAGILWVALFVNIDTVELEAFGIESNSTIIWNQQTITGQVPIHNGTSNIVIRAEHLTTSSSQLFGKTINCMELYIGKTGSPQISFPVVLGVFSTTVSNSIAETKYEFGRVNVTNITLDKMPFKRCNTVSDYTLITGDRVGLMYRDGDASNFITFNENSNNPFDGTITVVSSFNDATNTWTNVNTNDIGQITLTLENGSVSNVHSINFNDGATKIYMVAIGVMFMVLGAMQRLDKD